MAKKVTGYIKLQIPAGKATPAPPVGPALVQRKNRRSGRSDHPGCYYRICRQKLQLRYQDSAGSCSVKESLQDQIRFRNPEQDQSCYHL